MLTTKESVASSRAEDDSKATSDGGEMEAAPDGESDGDDVGERPNPTAVESAAEDLWDWKL